MNWLERRRSRRNPEGRPRGRPPHPDVLTPAEWRVLEEVRRGRTNVEIAERSGLSLNTVKTHVASILAKTGAADRRALAQWDGRPAELPARTSRGFTLPLLGWWSTGAAKIAAGGVAAAVFVGAVLLAFAMLTGAERDDVPSSLVGGVPGVTPFHLEATWHFGPDPQPPGAGSFVNRHGTEARLRWWWRDHQHFRIELHFTGPRLDEGTVTWVADGRDRWTHDSRAGTYRRGDLDADDGIWRPNVGFTIGPIGPPYTSVAELIAQLQSGPGGIQVEEAGVEPILGRTARVIEIGPRQRAADPPVPGIWRLSIDEGWMVVLREEYEWDDGGWSTLEVAQFDYGPAIPPDRFAFTPPPEARDVSGAEGGCGYYVGAPAARRLVDGTTGFLRFADIPDGWEPAAGGVGQALDCDEYSAWSALAAPNDDGYLIIEQHRRPDIPEAFLSAEPADVSGHEAYRIVEGDWERLVWAQDGVVALLESDTLPFDELLRLAESAEVVP